MKRRTFLLAGLGAGGALFLGWAFVPPRQRLRGRTLPNTTGGAVALNGWVTIAPDDVVTVVVPKAEMGQGIHTGLAMLLAEEMGCDWARVRVAHSPIDRIYANVEVVVDGLPFHPDAQGALVRGLRWMTAKTMREIGVMMTGGSSSIRDCWEPIRLAGASARAALVGAAAARAGVSEAECRIEAGTVIAGMQRFRFGELAGEALSQRPRQVALKPLAEFTLAGRPMPRLDAADKSRGATVYGMDVRLDGLRFAAVTMSPVFGGRPAGFDRDAALRRPGVRAVVPLEGSRRGDPAGVAVVADSWWQAKQGVAALAVAWDDGPHATLSSDDIVRTLRDAAAGDGGFTFRRVGDPDAAFRRAARVLEATYEAPYLAHTPMEPPNATVLLDGARAELWCGTQVPELARDTAAQVLGLPTGAVTLHQQVLGGGFGRRLEVDYVAQAAAIAKAVPGAPVQVIWTREDDVRHGMYRPAAVARMRAALDADGRLVAIASHSASQAPFKALARRIGFTVATQGPDRTTAEGTWDQPYEFAALRARHAEVTLPVPVGSWRSVGHSHQGFFLEAFLDEVADAVGQDPVAFRLALLERHPRARRVLELAAEQSGWGSPVAPATDGAPMARGVALHWSFGTTVAQVAEVSLDVDRRIRVHRMVVAVDCGFPVNPNLVTQQMESAVVYGLTAALHGEITIANGRVTQGNFNDYPALRLRECPALEVHIVPSMEAPSGVGEPGLPPVAPAVANAVYRLTGQRLRRLPLRVDRSEASS
jgi:isoquinoline 1-oxidoreductase beta subunit